MLHANDPKRPDVIKERAKWREIQKTLEIEQLVFIDECGVNTAMTRLYGWGEKGARVEDYVPDARFERTTVLSAVRLSGVEVSVSFEGALKGDIFGLWVKCVLTPALRVGDVVLLNSLSSHKVAGVLDPVFERGAFVWFLPVYLSDLNPFLLLWSKLRAFLRKLKAWSLGEL
ncbi:MAG: transposase [Nitrososphaerota archaeon]|jgi:transposase|nr:transposase [Nitrososphaerota archaeon]